MPNIVLDLILERVDLVDAGANSEAFIEICKRKESVIPMELDEILAKLEPEHATVITAALAAAKEAVPETTATVMTKMKNDLETALADVKKRDEQIALTEELAKKKETDATFEEVLKTLDPTVQAAFEALNKKTQAAEMIAKQLSDERAYAESLEKARQLKALPAEEEALAKMLDGIQPEVFELLKGVNKLIEDSPAFKEVGKSRTDDSTATGDAAWEKIEKKAKEISCERSITEAAAIAVVIKEFPQMYKDYLERSHE